MKTKLEFEFDSDDLDDRRQINDIMKASALRCVIETTLEALRQKLKYEELEEDKWAAYQEIRGIINELLVDYDIQVE